MSKSGLLNEFAKKVPKENIYENSEAQRYMYNEVALYSKLHCTIGSENKVQLSTVNHLFISDIKFIMCFFRL